MSSGVEARSVAGLSPLSVHIVDEDGRVDRSGLALEDGAAGRGGGADGVWSAPQATFMLLTVIVGLGFLALPWCFAKAGWVAGTTLLAAAALVMARTAQNLVECMMDDRGQLAARTFPDLAVLTFGERARVVVSSMFALELLGAAVAVLVLSADNLSVLLAPHFPIFDGVFPKIVTGVVGWLSTFLDLSALAATSLLGIASSISLVFAVLYNGLSNDAAPGSLWQPAATSLWPASWQAAMVVGIFVNCMSCHGVLPSICLGTRDQTRMPPVVYTSFSIAFFLYLTLAAVGYLMFGNDAKDILTENLAMPGRPNVILNRTLAGLMVIIPITKFPLLIDAVAVALRTPLWNSMPKALRKLLAQGKTKLPAALGGGGGASSEPSSPHADADESTPLVAAGRSREEELYPAAYFVPVLRSSLVLLVAAVAVAFPSFSTMLSLIGAMLTCSMSITFPCVAHLALKGHGMGLAEKALDGALFVFGMCLATVGTVSAVASAVVK